MDEISERQLLNLLNRRLIADGFKVIRDPYWDRRGVPCFALVDSFGGAKDGRVPFVDIRQLALEHGIIETWTRITRGSSSRTRR